MKIMLPQNLSLQEVVPQLKKFSQKKFDLYTQSVIFEQKQQIQQACGLLQDHYNTGINQDPIESCMRRFFQRHNINTQDQNPKPIEIQINRLDFNNIIFRTETQLIKFLVQFSSECLNINVNSQSEDYQMKFDYLIIELDSEAYKELYKNNTKLEWFKQYIIFNQSILNQQNQLKQKYRLANQQSFINDKDNFKILVFQKTNIGLRENLLEALNRSLVLTEDQNLSSFTKQGKQIIPAQFYNQLYSDQNKLNILMKINKIQSADNSQLVTLTGKQDTKEILCEIIDTIEIATELIRWEEILNNFMEKNLLTKPEQIQIEKQYYDIHLDKEMEKFRDYIKQNKQFNFQEPQLCNEDLAVEINHYIQQGYKKPCVLYKITQSGIQMMCQNEKLRYAVSFSFTEQTLKFIGNIAQFLIEEDNNLLQIYFIPQAKARTFFQSLIKQEIFGTYKQKLVANIIHGIHFQLFRFTLNAKTLKLWEKKEKLNLEFPIPSQTFKNLNL